MSDHNLIILNLISISIYLFFINLNIKKILNKKELKRVNKTCLYIKNGRRCPAYYNEGFECSLFCPFYKKTIEYSVSYTNERNEK